MSGNSQPERASLQLTWDRDITHQATFVGRSQRDAAVDILGAVCPNMTSGAVESKITH
jgi:hypothetical protein